VADPRSFRFYLRHHLRLDVAVDSFCGIEGYEEAELVLFRRLVRAKTASIRVYLEYKDTR
jgi:hypothetical protein